MLRSKYLLLFEGKCEIIVGCSPQMIAGVEVVPLEIILELKIPIHYKYASSPFTNLKRSAGLVGTMG